MRVCALLFGSVLVSVTATKARADEAKPPTAAFELLPPEPEPDAGVAEVSPVEPPSVPDQNQWVPLSNSTDYHGGFDRPWTPPRPPPSERRWYGWQTLLADAASIGLFVSGVNDEDGSDIRPAIGLFGYALGAPIIHTAHGHVLKAFGSLGLRLGAPVVGAFVGYGMAGCEGSSDADEGDWCGVGGAVVGTMLGAAGAMLFDAAVIANEDVESERPKERVELRPDVSVAPGRAHVGLSGTF